MPKAMDPNPATKVVTARAFAPVYSTDDASGVASPVLFETDWRSDTGYQLTATGGLWSDANVPTGWTAARNSALSTATVIGAGGAGNVLRVAYDSEIGAPNLNLGKHLTGSAASGWRELYVRMRFSFPDAFRAGSGNGNLPYWKWLRLWQSMDPTDYTSWTENRADSGFCVFAWAGPNAPNYGIEFRAYLADLDPASGDLANGSAGGPHHLTAWDGGLGVTDSAGHWDALSGMELDWVTNAGEFATTPQVAHTIEVGIKAASSVGASDGEVQFWFDGSEQSSFSLLEQFGGTTGLTTLHRCAALTGWNHITLFDNMTGWNADWDQPGVDGYVDLQDFVVSRAPIGSSYVVGP